MIKRQQTPVEERFAALMRDRAVVAIAANGHEWAAEQLGVKPFGVRALLWDTKWPIDVAVHVAASLRVLTNQDVDKLAVR